MILKKLNKGTYIFEKQSGITAFFSDNEEKMLYNYLNNGVYNEFIERLYNLKVLVKGKKVIIKNTDIDLQSIHIDITDSCPLNCHQCYKSENQNKYMDFKIFKKTIDEAKNLNCFQIALGGGEPLLHKDIVEMVAYVSETEMSISLTSSGFGLNKSIFLKLRNAGINHIQISLNGSTKKINDLSRDGYIHAINSLELLHKSDVSFGINTVVRRDNLNDLQNIINLCKKYKVENLNLLRYKPNIVENYKLNELDTSDINKLVEVIRKNRDINIKVDSAFTPLLMLVNNGKVSVNQCGCGALSKFINITTDGVFKPCSHINLEEGTDSILNYFTKSDNKKTLENLNYIKDGKCTDCKFKINCYGCLAITQFKCGIIEKGENDCKMFRNIFN